MTVSATATAAAVFFSFVFAATASTAVATASAAFTAHQFEDAFHFLVGCIAHFHYGTFKNQVFTSMRVVQVEHHFIFCDFANVGIELMAFCIVQHDDVAFEDIVAIEFSIRPQNIDLGTWRTLSSSLSPYASAQGIVKLKLSPFFSAKISFSKRSKV